MDSLLQDLRFAFRTLRRNPGYTVAALLTLMLGIGANTAVVSVVQGVLLAPLPYPASDRLTVVREESMTGGRMGVAWRNFADWQERSRSFEAMAAFTPGYVATVLADETPLRLGVSTVSVDFFRTLGVIPIVGRGLLPEEHRLGADPAAVVSEGFWRTHLGGDPDLTSRHVTVGSHRARIVGVIPSGLAFPEGVDVWSPLELNPPSEHRTAHNYEVIARLAPGVTLQAADQDLDAITRTFLDEEPGMLEEEAALSFFPRSAAVQTLQDAVVGDVRRPLWILLGASVLVLLVACTNLASATLARGTARAQEYAVRRSLGAGRGVLIRQLLSEGVVLALGGGALGVLLAAGALRLLPALAPAGVPRLGAVGLDGTVLIVALGVTLLTALLFGLLPTLRLTASDFAVVIRGSRGGIERGRHRIWKVLIAVEVALALLLLVGSALLVRSFLSVLSVDAGYRTAGLMTATVSPPAVNYGDDAAKRRYYDELLRALEALPGVAQVGLVSSPPMDRPSNGRVDVRGGPVEATTGEYQLIAGDYFQTLGIPLLRGRYFDERDHAASADVVIVNRTFAEQAWPGQDPIGRQMTGGGMDAYGGQNRWATVVGVVADVRQRDLTTEPQPTYYFLLSQRPFRARSMTGILRPARGDAAALATPVREAVRRIGADVPVSTVTIETSLSDALVPRRFTVLVLGAFAAVALALAAVGIWGVVAYAVARRTREIGIRIALGAEPRAVRRLVQRDYLIPVAVGGAAGMVLAFWLTRVLEGLLYEVRATDPAAFVAVAVVLGAAAWLASFVPAVRGTRVSPMETMRAD